MTKYRREEADLCVRYELRGSGAAARPIAPHRFERAQPVLRTDW